MTVSASSSQSSLSPLQPPASSAAGVERAVLAPSSAVGFGNESKNCWCNSLLQMVVHIPSFRTAYETFANSFQNNAASIPNQHHSSAMLRALAQYEIYRQADAALPPSISQNVRLAMNHFFPDAISPSPHRNEDAYEALQLLMGVYEQVAERSGIPLLPALYTPMETSRVYEPEGAPRAADPEGSYTRLAPDQTSSHTHPEYQIFIDLQNRGERSFEECLAAYFQAEHSESEPAVYLRADDQVQDFKLRRERRRFQSTPRELILSVKRFGFNPQTQEGFKITAPIAIPRALHLPEGAIASADRPAYDLDAFIVHAGGYGRGHYIAYRKLPGGWVEISDSFLRSLPEHEIERILRNPIGSDTTSYIHYYKLRVQEGLEERLAVHDGIASQAPEVLNQSVISESSLPRRLAAELKEVEDQLKRYDPSDPMVHFMQFWHTQFVGMLRLRNLDPQDLQVRFVTALESVFKKTPFSPELFGERAPPIVKFMIRKMRNQRSVFFSAEVNQAAEVLERSALRERAQRIKALREQRAQQEVRGMLNTQALIERVREGSRDKNAQIAAIGDQFQADIAPIRQGIEELAQDIPEQERKTTEALAQLRQEIAELKEDIKELKQKQEVVQHNIETVEQELAQLEVATKELEVAINEVKEACAGNILLSIGIAVVSAVVTWGFSTAIGLSVAATKQAVMASISLSLGGTASKGKK